MSKTSIPKVIKLKKPTINSAELDEAYQWIPFGKHLAFPLALDWYQVNAPKLLCGQPLTPEGMTNYRRAEKSATLGNLAGTDGEREQAYRTSLRLYEKVFADAHKLPRFNEDAPVNPNRRVAAMASTVTTLNSAFKGLGMQFIPTVKPEREFNRDSGKVLVPVEQLTTMSNSALLGAAFAEFVSAVKCASLIPGENGTMKLDGAKLLNEAIPKALEGILAWAETVPLKDLLKQRVVAPGKQAKVKGAPRQKSTTPKAKCTGGLSSKDVAALDLLKRPGGATKAEIMSATGWTGLWFNALKATGVVINTKKGAHGTVYSAA